MLALAGAWLYFTEGNLAVLGLAYFLYNKTKVWLGSGQGLGSGLGLGLPLILTVTLYKALQQPPAQPGAQPGAQPPPAGAAQPQRVD